MDRQFPNRFWLTPDQQLGLQEFRYRRSYIYPRRLQDEYVLVIPMSGEIRVQEGDRPEHVTPGDVLVGNSYHWRASSYGVNDWCHGLTLIASRRFVQSLMAALGHPECSGFVAPVFPGVARIPGIIRAAEDILSELDSRRCGRDYLLELLAREMLVRQLRSLPGASARTLPHVERVLSRRHYVSALEYMQECRKSEFSVVGLSHRLGLSSEEFTRLFHRSTGITPLSTYNRLLIGRANELFQSGAGSVKEVAAILEF